jgi:hypothetical protein
VRDAINDTPESKLAGSKSKNGLELVGADPGAGFCLAPTQELYAGKLPQVAAAGPDRLFGELRVPHRYPLGHATAESYLALSY